MMTPYEKLMLQHQVNHGVLLHMIASTLAMGLSADTSMMACKGACSPTNERGMEMCEQLIEVEQSMQELIEDTAKEWAKP